MATAIQVAGPVTCRTDTGAANALEDLGITRSGVEITFHPYFLDVPTDTFGGDHGAPEDIQYMGQIAVIRMHFTKFDTAVGDKIRAMLYGGTAGTIGTKGTLMRGQTKSYRLVLNCTTTPYNFPFMFFREPHEIGKGTKYSEWVVSGTAYENASGVLYNATVA